MTSVTADTNIYISALIYPGPPLRLLNLGRTGLVRIDISDAIVTEMVRVLREKFEWDGYRLHSVKEQILKYANRVAPVKTFDVIREDPDDNRVLECAVEAKSNFIVSADTDLLRLGEFQGIQIVTAAQFFEQHSTLRG